MLRHPRRKHRRTAVHGEWPRREPRTAAHTPDGAEDVPVPAEGVTAGSREGLWVLRCQGRRGNLVRTIDVEP